MRQDVAKCNLKTGETCAIKPFIHEINTPALLNNKARLIIYGNKTNKLFKIRGYIYILYMGNIKFTDVKITEV